MGWFCPWGRRTFTWGIWTTTAWVRDLALLNDHIAETPSILSSPGPFDAKHATLADINRDGAINVADREELIREILQSRNPEQLPLASVRFTSPAAGEGDVSVNRETIVHFTVPLAINATLDTTKFYAEFAGRKVLSRVEISSDRKKASLFYLEPARELAREGHLRRQRPHRPHWARLRCRWRRRQHRRHLRERHKVGGGVD